MLNWTFMRRARIWAALAAMAVLVCLTYSVAAAGGAKKKAPAKKKASTPASAAKKSGASPSARRGKTSSKRSATTWRNRQMAPTPERYREIQQALANKGYLKPEEANGAWSASSADALKRFQSEQNLESNGKINSLSLIALGLGPKRDTPAVPKPPPPAPDPPANGK